MANNKGNRSRRGPHSDKLEAIQSVRHQLACAEAHVGLHEYEPDNDDLHEAAVEQVEAAQRQLAELLAALESPAEIELGAENARNYDRATRTGYGARAGAA